MKFTVKPSLETVAKRGALYVREIVRSYENGVLVEKSKPIYHGPFHDRDQAGRFMPQRGMWLQGLYQHWAKYGAGAPYPEFVFDEDDPRSGIEYLADMAGAGKIAVRIGAWRTI